MISAIRNKWISNVDSKFVDGSVVGLMKLGYTAPRVGFEPTSQALWISVLPLHHVGFPDITTIPPPTFLCNSLYQRSVKTTVLNPLDL